MAHQPHAGKIALITGATKGIGAAVATQLAREGATVVLNYSRDADAANTLVDTIGSEDAFAVQADAGSVAGVQELVRVTVEKYGRIDILMANAAVMPMADLEHTSEEMFDSVFNLNVKGPFFLTQAAAPHMPSGSHIILISTSLTVSGNITPDYLSYVTSKGAIEQMARLLSKDLGRKGIRVNAVAPGPTGTELFYKGKSEQVLNMIAGMNPFKRIGEPEEIAEVVSFLAGEGARWVSGQTVRVNGGMA
ncbi:NAD(P)-binding protein [Trichodelitschia bisporula]|uniref:NAD(P)-binding protein n=1 Tax=Trichodelitschia bisporula TaxID=703511 RepID=A0A6G1HHU8_9PEZI|nr:NAD(P)-binding protein [Trichodelitschia bisporula]